MSASGGISLDLTVVFFFVVVVAFWNSVSSDVPHLTSLAKRSIILYFQTEEGGAAKKN